MIIADLLAPILTDYRWFRKKKGGTWYKVYVKESATGFAGSVVFWTQELDEENHEILKEEKYDT